MIQCVDDTGRPITGLYRNSVGALVVNDQNAYHKYMQERAILLAKDKKIADLEERLNKLAAVVELLQQNKV